MVTKWVLPLKLQKTFVLIKLNLMHLIMQEASRPPKGLVGSKCAKEFN